MNSTKTMSKTVSTALATALVLLSPGLPFYTAFAATIAAPVAAPVGIASAGAWAGAFSRIAAIQNGRAQMSPAYSRVAAIDWSSPLGRRSAESLGLKLESAGHTPETFEKLDSAAQSVVLNGAEAAVDVTLPAASSVVSDVQSRVEATTGRVESIARALGNASAPAAVAAPVYANGSYSKIRVAKRAGVMFNGAAQEHKPSKAAKAASTAAAIVTKAAPTATTVALAALPLLALHDSIAQAVQMNSAAAIAIVGFVAGARAARDVARHTLKRLKVAGPAYGGAMSLAVMAGGAVIAVAAGALGMMSPVAAAVAVSAAVVGGSVMTTIHTPKVEPLVTVNSAGGSEKPMLAIAKQSDKHVLILPKDAMGKPYMLSASLVKGLGEKELYSSWLAGEFLFTFKRVGDQVHLVAKNTSYRAAKGSPLERTFDKSIPDSTVAAAKIVGEDAAKGTVAIVLDEIFTEDLMDLKKGISAQFGVPYADDEAGSGLEEVKAFPANVEITSRLQFNALAASDAPSKLLNTKNLSLSVRYSLSALPEGDYAPRKADDRIGFFSTVFQDWTDGQKRDLTTRYVNRWNLEKVDPTAAVSPVKKPIVYWLENTVPVEYREAVTRGILEWNKAFEKIGFKDAIVVKQQPEPKAAKAVETKLQKLAKQVKSTLGLRAESEPVATEDEYFDPADARFNVVRWFMNTDDYVLAIAPSRANPYTGQLYNAGIAFHAAFTRPGNVLQLAGIGDPSEKEEEALTGHKHSSKCSHGRELEKHAATALAVLEGRGDLTPEQKKRFVEDFITETVVHEAGHTLGLRHNFAASSWKSLDEMDGEDPYSASVMDYNNVNLAAPGAKQGPFFQTKLGPYDFKAIEYAYKPLEGDQKAQDKELERIAASLSKEGLAYATDEDVVGIDPMIQRWDMGKDPVEFAKRRISIVHDLWQRLEKQELSEGTDYQRLTNSYMRAFMQFYTAVGIAVKNIGGISFHRDHAGNAAGREPFTPVSKAEQLKTLEFLKDFVFSDAKLKVSPELLRKLAPERQPTLDDPYPALGYVPYHKYVLAIRLQALNHIFNPRVLERLADSEHMARKGEELLQPLELFNSVTNAIWSELNFQPKPEHLKRLTPKEARRASEEAAEDEGEEGEEAPTGKIQVKYVGPEVSVSALRRELQMAHIERLMLTAFGGFGVPEASTMAQQMLVSLSSALKATVQMPWWDFETRAHLQRALLKTVQAMEMGPLMVRRAAAADDDERHSRKKN